MKIVENVGLTTAELRLRNGAMAPLFRKYALPSVVALLFMGLQAIIDGAVLGNFVGAHALASVSLIFPCYNLMIAIAIVFGVGCQTLISIRLGEIDRQGANDSLRSGFVFLLSISVLISVILYLFAAEVATLMGANEALLAGSVDYLRALTPFFPLIVCMLFSDYVIKAMGRPIYSMVVVSSTVIINIVLDILFVAYWDMGIYGAGLATGIAFTIGALWNLPLVLFGRKILSIRQGKFRWSLVGQMAYNGSSEGISDLSSGITTLLFNLVMMQYFAESGVAAYTAISYVFFISVTIYLGVADGIIPIVSYNYGAHQWSRIKAAIGLAAKSNFVIGLILFCLLSFWGESIISLFFKNGEIEVMRIASRGITIYAFAFLINGLNILASSYFTAIANAKVSVVISLLRGLIFTVVGLSVVPDVLGVEYIWYVVPIAELLTFGISCWLVRGSFREQRG